ncbi:nucleotide exchange factor GrpE [Dactylosporangium sp. NPDC051541]|uniref:nucleotide exchange factor GrpE n=1 Tax=Dactylosporangium sp. NPDC051541 TaxID=3363977 RepID=UPI0037A5F1FB
MSSNSLRLFAVAVALVIAVLTGVATGLLGGAPNCPAQTVTASAPAVDGPAAVGSVNPGENNNGTPIQPENNTATKTLQAKTQACTAQESFGVKPALVAFVGTLFVGAALLLLLLLSTRGRGGAAPVSAPPGGGGQSDADRRALVQATIYVRDRVTSKALGDRLGTALHEAGVSTLEPTGVRFDPAHHEAGGTTPTNDPGLNGQISGVEVPGYVDRDGRVLRAPIVTVFQAGRNAGGATGAHPTVQQPATGRRPAQPGTATGQHPIVPQSTPPHTAPPTHPNQTAPQTHPNQTTQPRREQPR